jgi:hypothetical protein
MLIIEAAVADFVLGVEPVGPDDGEQDVTCCNFGTQHLNEIQPERNGVDVHEQRFAAKLLLEPVIDTAGRGGAVVSPVTY